MADDIWSQAAATVSGATKQPASQKPSGDDVWGRAAATVKGINNPPAAPDGLKFAPTPVPKELQPDPGGSSSIPGMISIPGSSFQVAADAINKASRPGFDSKAGAAHDILGEAGKLMAPLALPLAAVEAPVATAASLGLGALGQWGGKQALTAMGAGPGVSDLGSDVTGIAAGSFGPKLSPAIVKAASKLPASVADFFKVNRGIAAIKAWSPTPSEYGFENRIEDTTDRIQDAFHKPIKTNAEAIEATQKALDLHKEAYHDFLDTAAKRGQTVDGDIIVKATEDSIPSTLKAENPEAADAILAKSRAAYGGKKLPVKQVESLREEKTADLRSLYNGSDAAQIATKNGTSDTGILKAQRDAIADHLYKAIDQENGGAGPRGIQLQRSDMIDILDAAKRRSNVAIGSKPVSGFAGMMEAVPNTIKAVMNPAGGVGFVKNPTIVNPGTIFKGAVDPWVAKVFKGASKPSAIPRPAAPTVAGLLEPGATRMTTPDTSGPIPSEPQRNPGFWNSMLKDKQRLLPAASTGPQVGPSGNPIITPAPSGSFPVSGPLAPKYPVGSGNNRLLGAPQSIPGNPGPFGMSMGDDLVPVKNKQGKIEYIPKWMLQKPQ